ncbi:hypothetical protein BSKO_11455 [Bryopsis sp. KO-2023]|nr:hypothetical protein BSKO_11455 [Bryopsis sp. KO-2023]
MTAFTIALDWTPNTNHTGFYVAKHKGWYAEAGLDVTLLSPHVDQYKTTPASRLVDGSATFAIAPSETVVSYATQPEGSAKPKITAVAAVLQGSTSAVVTLKSGGIDRPSKLEGKNYASYGARYEGRIIQEMIKNDGGSGDYKESTPPMLGIWNTLLKGEADATWVFMGWEGIEAKRKGVELNSFALEDYGVPHGYSIVLAADPAKLSGKEEQVKKFMDASKRGYEFAAKNPTEAADILVTEVEKDYAAVPLPTPLEKEMVCESQAYLSNYYLDKNGSWGTMEESRWSTFLEWLSKSGLLTEKVQSREPVEGISTSLDGLRQGDAGKPVPLPSIKIGELFTNAFL